MKINDIDFSKYEYKRICVMGNTRVHFPPDMEELVKREYGDCELAEEPIQKDNGWLVLSVVK